MAMRKSGILMPVFSLPGGCGIGCFSKEAYIFIDKLAKAGQSYWQILPLNHVGGWYSPYQPLSCFALDPMFIDPFILYEEGLVCSSAMTTLGLEVKHSEGERIDYKKLLPPRMELYKLAFESRQIFSSDDEEFDSFCRKNRFWLDDYSLFIELSRIQGTVDWSKWEKPYRFRDAKALKEFSRENSENILFHKWLQFKAHSQWQNVVNYAHSKGIEIIGDIPIYAAYESADCWANPEMFKLTKALKRQSVSGCPPDGFSPTGQVWGNPLYKWKYHKDTGYDWWIKRLKRNFELYDVIRLDHFRGFESFFSIPAKDDSAENGRWMRGPKMELFDAIKKAIPGGKFIAEDLGYITPAVEKLKDKTGFPGMKVLQFAFDGNPANPYLPENFEENSVAYSGTHDNDTTVGWYRELDDEMKGKVTEYLRSSSGRQPLDSKKAPAFGATAAARSLVSITMRSKADTCIIPIQDYLLLDSSGRVNVPGTTGLNWSWKMDEAAFNDDVISYIAALTHESNREPKQKEK